jgi:rubrerythrin
MTTTDLPPPRLGTLDTELIRFIDRHCEAEAEQTDAYRALAASPNEAVRYLAQLLADDEARHHQVLMEMRNHLMSSATGDQEPRVPNATRVHDPVLRRTVRRLRGVERRDLRSLRTLRRKLGVLREGALHGALVDAMVLDTKKHLRYLRRLDQLCR